MSHSKRRISLIPNPNVTGQLISSWSLAEVESSISQNTLQSNALNPTTLELDWRSYKSAKCTSDGVCFQMKLFQKKLMCIFNDLKSWCCRERRCQGWAGQGSAQTLHTQASHTTGQFREPPPHQAWAGHSQPLPTCTAGLPRVVMMNPIMSPFSKQRKKYS